MQNKKLWVVFVAVIVISFAVLGHYGREIYRQSPPTPVRVVTVTRAGDRAGKSGSISGS